MTDTALIIFTRNPELGKCKTRLAKTLGDAAALNIYKHLLKHTRDEAIKVASDCYVFYSEEIIKDDMWSEGRFTKKLQIGRALGVRMKNAFSELFDLGYKKVSIIGSDLLDLNHHIIQKSFEILEDHDVVIGPAKDGGYYLLALKQLPKRIFENKQWGTDSVLRETLKDLQEFNVHLLKELNDIDTFEDMQHYNDLKPYYTI